MTATENYFSGRIPQLDGIRGLAIILVLAWHYVYGQIQLTPGTPAAYMVKLLSLTWAGVDVFFVLSGFLIGGILLEQLDSPNYFYTFYIRRFCRIFPLYYGTFFLFAIAVCSNAHLKGKGAAWLFGEPLPLWSYAAYLQNYLMAFRGEMSANWIAMTWSLAIEEQFYFILPLMLRMVPSSYLMPSLTGVIISAPVIRGILYYGFEHGGLAGYLLLPARWDALFVGVLGAWILRDEKRKIWICERKTWIYVILLGCSLIMMIMLLFKQGIGSPAMSLGGYTVIAIFSLSLIYIALLDKPSRISRLFSSSILVWVGAVSYGIYMFHQPVAGVLHHFFLDNAPRIADLSSALVTVLALALTFWISAISWRFFEKPFVQYGRKFTYGK